MLDDTRIGLKVDVDTLRGTREGVPRLTALFKKLNVDATFYFSVGPDHTGRAMRRVFRKGFAQKVARTSVLKHYGLKTLLYGVLLPGPDIGREAGDVMRGVRDGGFEVGLHTYDHVRWQDYVAGALGGLDADRIRARHECLQARVRLLSANRMPPPAGKSIAHALELEREYGLSYASDTRGRTPFWPVVGGARSSCPQLPTTLPTFDELLGRDGIEESNLAEAVFQLSEKIAPPVEPFAGIHAARRVGRNAAAQCLRVVAEEVAGRGRRADAEWRRIREWAILAALPDQTVIMGEVPGRSGLLAIQPPGAEAA